MGLKHGWPLIEGKGLTFVHKVSRRLPESMHLLFIELTREPMAQELDREARRRPALAGEELVRCYRAGLLKDHGHVADLLAFAGLLAEDTPLCAAA